MNSVQQHFKCLSQRIDYMEQTLVVNMNNQHLSCVCPH